MLLSCFDVLIEVKFIHHQIKNIILIKKTILIYIKHTITEYL